MSNPFSDFIIGKTRKYEAMKKYCSILGFLIGGLMSALFAQMKIEHDPGGIIQATTNGAKPLTYGLKITTPWEDDTGHVIINLPEHINCKSAENGILHWDDNRTTSQANNPWIISKDKQKAEMEVESPHLPGVWIKGHISVKNTERLEIIMGIENKTSHPVTEVRALYCVMYRMIKGFPRWGKGLPYTYVQIDGKLECLKDLSCKNPKSSVRWARIKGSDREPTSFADKHGAVMQKEVDDAIAIATSRDGKKKIGIRWCPGGDFLTNTGNPCLHADPDYGTIPAGGYHEARGVIILSKESLESLLSKLMKGVI